MKIIIEDEYLSNLYQMGKTIGKSKFNTEIERGFVKRMVQIEQSLNVQNLRELKSLHLEKLSGNLAGKYSIQINLAYRILFRIEKDGHDNCIEIICFEELNNHYS